MRKQRISWVSSQFSRQKNAKQWKRIHHETIVNLMALNQRIGLRSHTLCNTESCTRCTWCVFSCISRYVFFYMHVFSCNAWYILSHTLSHGVSPHTLETWCVFGKTSLISFCGFVTTRAEAVLLDWNLRLKIITNCFPHFQLFIIKTQHTMDICLGPVSYNLLNSVVILHFWDAFP